MIQGSAMSKDDLLCKQYKNTDRHFQVYRGFRMPCLKLILEYSFAGFVINVQHNHNELQFDIYLSKFHNESKAEINMIEVEKFRKFYGRGFNLIIWSKVD